MKAHSSTVELPWILAGLSSVEAGGTGGVAVKCLDTAKNPDCAGSLARVPTIMCWQLTIGVALVAGLNPTPHGTS